MNIQKQASGMDMQVKLSTLWIIVMWNMVFADILSFMTPGALQQIMTGSADGLQITQGILLVFAVLLEIPIAMILLSRTLKYGANRRANIIASVITIVFVIGGGSPYLHYIFFAAMEVICMLLIIWYAWKWSDPEGQP